MMPAMEDTLLLPGMARAFYGELHPVKSKHSGDSLTLKGRCCHSWNCFYGRACSLPAAYSISGNVAEQNAKLDLEKVVWGRQKGKPAVADALG